MVPCGWLKKGTATKKTDKFSCNDVRKVELLYVLCTVLVKSSEVIDLNESVTL